MHNLSGVISLIFSQQFLLRALLVGSLISLCCALLGVSLVLKRYSMIGDGLSHVGFGALAIACAANVAPLYFSLPIVVIAAFLLLRMNETGKIKGDAAIALISTGALAVGVMVTSLTTGMNVDIYNYMFGSILAMSRADVAISVVLSVAVIVFYVVFYDELFAVTFDESFAKATGTKVAAYNMLIAAMTAVTIVIGMRMMGALLISSLIIFPTVTSMRVCKGFKSVTLTSAVVSVVCFLFGLFVSIRFTAPTGASVVCVNIFALAVFTLIDRILSIPKGHKAEKFKKICAAAVGVISLVSLLFLCLGGEVNVTEKERLSVVATSFAPYDFARQIGKGRAETTMLLSPGEESHTYEPTAADIMKIQNCDVFIYGGGESDEWVEDILGSIDTEKIAVIRMMQVTGAVTEKLVEGMEAEEEEGEAEYDEHVWTSPTNAIKITKAILNAMCEKDGNNAGYYQNNAKSYMDELQGLDVAFSALRASAKDKYFVVGDRFPFRYLADRYSFRYYAAFPGCSAQTEANPVTLAFLINKIKSEKIPVVFKVDLSTGNIASSISEATGAKVMTLYSCHVISADDYANGETYVSLMKRNIDGLTAAYAY